MATVKKTTTKKTAKKSATKAKTTTAKKTRKPTARSEKVYRYHVLTREEAKRSYLITDKKGITWEFWYDKEGQRHSQIWRLPDMKGLGGTEEYRSFLSKQLEKFKISDDVIALALPLKDIRESVDNEGYMDGFVIVDANGVEHYFYFKRKVLEYDGWCAPARLVLKPKVKKTTARKTAKKTAPKAKKTTKK